MSKCVTEQKKLSQLKILCTYMYNKKEKQTAEALTQIRSKTEIASTNPDVPNYRQLHRGNKIRESNVTRKYPPGGFFFLLSSLSLSLFCFPIPTKASGVKNVKVPPLLYTHPTPFLSPVSSPPQRNFFGVIDLMFPFFGAGSPPILSS